jgi:hypothetical protein
MFSFEPRHNVSSRAWSQLVEYPFHFGDGQRVVLFEARYCGERVVPWGTGVRLRVLGKRYVF